MKQRHKHASVLLVKQVPAKRAARQMAERLRGEEPRPILAVTAARQWGKAVAAAMNQTSFFARLP